ncbi:MAG: DUF262 domain-containing protein [Acidovorax sp.]|uniref:DUF262 domain-containing protein n=1 Tax=Acidovorax sp. TaxID=1872122 RepID=UPI00391D4240
MSIDKDEEFSGTLPDMHPPKDVVAFNELRSCADLYRLYKEGTLDIQPDFQRDVVWKLPEQTVFIDSLIKQLPIPSMCFSLDFNTQKWQVVDGLQRMTSIVNFLDEQNEWRLSRRKDIHSKISGRTNFDIRDGDAETAILYKKIQNLSLPITVIRCDLNKTEHAEYLFTIFHRLNSGGSRLNHQEIRNCIYSGSFNDLLKDLDKSPKWKLIKNLLPGKGSRFKSLELILRFFALYQNQANYTGTMPTFLNSFMRENRNADKAAREDLSKIFNETVEKLVKATDNSKETKFGYIVFEAALIGIAHNLERLKKTNDVMLGNLLTRLINSTEVSLTSNDTTSKESVIKRIAISKKIFAN